MTAPKTEPAKTDEKPPKIKFSIGAKLVTIITIIVLISLGTISVLVSYLVSEDVRLSSEVNNFEVNRRSAMEADTMLENTQANAIVLIQMINASGGNNAFVKQAAQYFFDRNPYIAALNFAVPGQQEQFLVNDSFFFLRDIEVFLAEYFLQNSKSLLERASLGDTVLINASPDFKVYLLALFFPLSEGGMGFVLFSPERLTDTFGMGINQSYMINSEGDILVHSDYELVLAGANASEKPYVRDIRENPAKNMQYLTSDEEGVQFFAAFTKLNTGASTVITLIEYDKVFEGIAATTRRNVYLTTSVLCISILFIWFFSKSISIPLKNLAAAAQSIEGGTFEIKLRHSGSDELGLLSASFKKMSTALSIFGKFTNKEIAVRSMRGEIKPGGFARHATVFFSDIRGFTKKSEEFTREFGDEGSDRVIQWLNDYFNVMVECIEKTEGVVDHFIGDAVLAHWGTAYSAGSPRKDAFNCVKAALMMRMALVKLNFGRKPGERTNPPIQIGCGINTGIVTAGQLGSDLRMEYTVIGDPVNLASRTEELNKPLGTDILITENTWNLVKDYIITEEMPTVNLKGKEKPVRMFAVINLVSLASGPRTLEDVRKILGTKAPNLSKINVNTSEKKYRFSGTG
ncbi:MAG: HAMP domain-containing protein [Treponema sp.]|jgi:adenylate cyclase|nr:HAMP domain-containing protein [Treponema sp.]